MGAEIHNLLLRDGQEVRGVGSLQFRILTRLLQTPSGELESARRICEEMSVVGDIVDHNKVRTVMPNLKRRLEDVDWAIIRVRAQEKPQNPAQKLNSTYYGFSPRNQLEEYGIVDTESSGSELGFVWEPERVRPLLLPIDLVDFDTRFGNEDNGQIWRRSRFATQAEVLEHNLKAYSGDLDLPSASSIIAETVGLMSGMDKVIRRVIEPLDVIITKDNLPGLLLYYLNYRSLVIEGRLDRGLSKHKIFPSMNKIAEMGSELEIITKYHPTLHGREQDYKYKEE